VMAWLALQGADGGVDSGGHVTPPRGCRGASATAWRAG
jgi:hypothetical protein